MMHRTLRVIGYWRDSSASESLPDVRDFIDESVPAGVRAAVVAYLRSGTWFVATAGFSRCRICGVANGSTDFTDGEHFVWPEGLAHYLETHGVWLPDDVTAIARRGLAGAVDTGEFERALLDAGEVALDQQWWASQRR
ncbi:hypothetical protein [Micromonospora pisi]|uniref:hypothetical protein n=1 Tax=Micromonospora pisi TaxID=589240 RepID=UPI0011C352AD|nr:hypothetical protein [Micromonospora pisi]